MLRLVLPFVGGLLIARSYGIGLFWLAALAVVVMLSWYVVSGKVRASPQRWLRGALLFPGLILFGMFWQELRSPVAASGSLSRARGATECWRARITEVISANDRTVRAWAQVNAAMDSTGPRPVKGGILLTLMIDSAMRTPATGDEVVLLARIDTIERIPDPGGFDQRSWAASYGVFHQCFARSDRWMIVHKAMGFASFFEGARQRIVRWLEHSDLNARERGMVKAILLGIRDELDQDQKTAFARSGTMHVLAVSGSHVALIYGFLLLAFKPLGERRRWKILRSVLILVVLWYYAGITGATPSVLRATATFSLFCVADIFGRNSDPVNSLAAAAFALLVWDPLMLGQLSFQLSFLAVLGIALFYRPILHLWTPRNLVLHYFWSLISVSIAAQLMTTPLALLSFKAFPVWFLPANLVIVGLVALGVYGGAALLVLQWIPYLKEAATGFMVLLLKAINWCSDVFAWLPGAYPALRIDAWQCVGLYTLVLLLAGWLFERWNWARNGTIAMIALLLLSWAWSARERNATHRFIVYDERDHLTCAVESGRALTVFTDSLDQWTRRKIFQHERSIGALSVDTVLNMPEMIELDGMSVRWLTGGQSRIDSTTAHQADLVIFSDDERYDPGRIRELFHPAHGFVLASTVSARRRDYLRRWCEAEGVPVHDVRTLGAYVR
jgi:competence protein ComEC